MTTLLDLLANERIQIEPSSSVAASVADKSYDNLLRYWNVTSYSQRQLLHQCARKYQLSMHRALGPRLQEEPNLDFAFGHAVGAGVQSWLIDGDLQRAYLNAMLAWRAGFDERIATKKKSLWEALIAVDSFTESWPLDEWELARLPNGKPAIELSFSLRAPKGFRDYGHIDCVLRNRHSGRYSVLELKTTAANADEAQYANSDQATGYSLMLPAIWPGLTDYTALYMVWESKKSEWHPMPFDKTVTQRAEWIKSLLLDHSAIATYQDISFYPKNGASCYSYNRRCSFFGTCNLIPEEELPMLEPDAEDAEPVDAVIQLADVIAELKKERSSS